MSFKKREYVVAEVTKKGEKSLQLGHPWIYDAEVVSLDGQVSDGDIVDVVSSKGRFIGSGFYNSNSKIRIRLISRNANDKFDQAFFERRIRYSWQYRKTVMGDDLDCCRVIFGEADTFPGLTVDKFHDILVVQTLSLGIERRKDIIFPLLHIVYGSGTLVGIIMLPGWKKSLDGTAENEIEKVRKVVSGVLSVDG